MLLQFYNFSSVKELFLLFFFFKSKTCSIFFELNFQKLTNFIAQIFFKQLIKNTQTHIYFTKKKILFNKHEQSLVNLRARMLKRAQLSRAVLSRDASYSKTPLKKTGAFGDVIYNDAIFKGRAHLLDAKALAAPASWVFSRRYFKTILFLKLRN
jgi:hypothetical protein